MSKISKAMSVGNTANEVVSALDYTTYQEALDTGKHVFFPDGDYTIDTASLTFGGSAQAVILSAGVKITQTTINLPVFTADTLDNVWLICNGAQLVGEGSWSAGWSGNSGHLDRVARFIKCTNSGITDPVIKNGASAGLSIEGCTQFRGTNLRIEGTHTHGTAIPSGDNFQNGVYVQHLSGFDCEDIYLTFDISGTAQGVLVESYAGYSGDFGGQFYGLIHDIPGQHGMYVQDGNVTIDVVVRDIELDGCKIQANQAGQDLNNIDVKVNALRTGSHALEIQDANGTATIHNVRGMVVSDECQRGLGLNANIKNSAFDVIAKDSTQHAAIIQGTGLDDLDIKVRSFGSGRAGFYVTASDCTRIRADVKCREANLTKGRHNGSDGDAVLTDTFKAFGVNEFNTYTVTNVTDGSTSTVTSNTAQTVTGVLSGGTDDDWDDGDLYTIVSGTYDGVLVESAGDIDFIRPEATDVNSNQRYGFFVDSATALVKVCESAIFTGAATASARSDVELEEWPEDVTLDGQSLTDLVNFAFFNKSPFPVKVQGQATSTSNVTIWQKPIPDESAFRIGVEMVIKKDDSTKSAAAYGEALVTRNAAGVAVLENSSISTPLTGGSSGAVWTFAVSGNNAIVRFNSGAAETHDAEAKVWYQEITN